MELCTWILTCLKLVGPDCTLPASLTGNAVAVPGENLLNNGSRIIRPSTFGHISSENIGNFNFKVFDIPDKGCFD